MIQFKQKSISSASRRCFFGWLEEYMIQMYLAGHSRRNAAETLNVLMQKFGWRRPMLVAPWNVIRTWESLEPVTHHPPMPVSVLRALAVTALARDWPKFGVLLVVGFFGLLRPSELLSLRRQDHALPLDHLETSVLYLRIGVPKTCTRERGPESTCGNRRAGCRSLDRISCEDIPYVATSLARVLEGLQTST